MNDETLTIELDKELVQLYVGQGTFTGCLAATMDVRDALETALDESEAEEPEPEPEPEPEFERWGVVKDGEFLYISHPAGHLSPCSQAQNHPRFAGWGFDGEGRTWSVFWMWETETGHLSVYEDREMGGQWRHADYARMRVTGEEK